MSDQLLGGSSLFQKVLSEARQYAKFNWPILITGETGVGKEKLAKYIHEYSSRSRSPFLAVNCGAMPPALFESELFGYERGSFSGAVQGRRGLIRAAKGGTLFLDEVGDLEKFLQVKLLRVLETGEVRSVGSADIEHVNIRFLSATNASLTKLIKEDIFRFDLYQRLNVLHIHIPPLRERTEDIAEFAYSIIAPYKKKIEPLALQKLLKFEWPGNIRQLKNILIRAVTFSEEWIESSLIEELLQKEAKVSAVLSERDLAEGTLNEIEQRIIVERLYRFQGNRKKAANDLGIAKSTLQDKLKKWKQSGLYVPNSRYLSDSTSSVSASEDGPLCPTYS